MSLNGVFFTAGIAAEVAVVALLLYRQIWRKLPVFLVYCAWMLLSDVVSRAIANSRPEIMLRFYPVATVIDCAIQLVVLMELARSLFRALDANQGRGLLAAIGASVLVAGATIWPVACATGLSDLPQMFQITVQLQKTVAILEILILVFLVGIARFLDLQWPNRTLQVAEGFGFYALVRSVVAVANSRLSPELRSRNLDLLVAGAFLVCLSFWVFEFAQPDACDGKAAF